VGKRAPQHPFEDNPFPEGFADWIDSPEGQLSREVSETVWELLERTDLDPRNREIIWDDGRVFDIENCIEHIHELFPDFPPLLIETHVLSWLECGFVPKGYSEAQMDEFDKRVERRINDYQRQRGGR
jgi:hypothetical protein